MGILATGITIGVDDERPIVTQYIRDEANSVVDLTGASSAKFYMYPVGEDGSLGTVKVNGAAASIASATEGKLTYTWITGDTDTPGRFFGYFRIFWGASNTIPETISAIEINIKNFEDRIA